MVTKESGDDLVPIKEAAQLLNTTEEVVLMMLEKKELQGNNINGAWYVDRSSLDLCDMSKTVETARQEGCGICGSSCGSGC